jgi:heat-inducible transcriptional repressor
MGTNAVQALSDRSREIFRGVVEAYLETGEPVGSRTLSQRLSLSLSSASIRNVMADLEQMGLLVAPHTSAGRMPTEAGLRMFVDGLLEIGDLAEGERQAIEGRLAASGRSLDEALQDASQLLSGLSRCAGLVFAPKLDVPLKHIEFVSLGPNKALVILVTEDGAVENRVIGMPGGLTPSALQEATNYLNARLRGRTLDEARATISSELDARRTELDQIAARVVEVGLATWSGEKSEGRSGTLIVRGHSNLLENVHAVEDLERLRMLFDDLEGKINLVQLLDLAQEAEGVRIFIGSENKLFSLSGSSLIVAPYMNPRQKIVGAIGVIGPTRLNYARIIPMVDYTAKVVGRLLG